MTISFFVVLDEVGVTQPVYLRGPLGFVFVQTYSDKTVSQESRDTFCFVGESYFTSSLLVLIELW